MHTIYWDKVLVQQQSLMKRLKELRKQRGWTQHILAAKAAISRGYLARLEIGRHDPPLSMLARLAKALRVSVVDLLQ